MATYDSFINTQNLFAPDIVQKISASIGQSTEKTKDALKSAIPEFLTGILDKGSTPEGASSLVDMVNMHSYESNVIPDENKLNEGNDVVNSIFGRNLSNTVSKLSSTTGLNSASITKMLGLVAPVIMGVIGTKVKNEKLSSTGLMNFFNQQKNILSSVEAKTSEFSKLSGEMPVKALAHKKISWKVIIAIAAIALIAMWFWWNFIQIDTSTSGNMTNIGRGAQ